MASSMFNTAPAAPSLPIQRNDPLTDELWNLCAPCTAGLPKVEQRVYYYLQGHMEQLHGKVNLEHDDQIPFFKLPCKILCRVVDIERMVERGSDEVYAQITLEAETYQTESTIPVIDPPENSRPKVQSFTKILTTSDTSTHGGLSVLIKHATECLPPLDMSQEVPTQELAARDLHGHEWRFKHVYRGQPRRHLLSTGWSTFVNAKNLVSGDAFVFLRGENGEMKVGIRRQAWEQPPFLSTIMSPKSLNAAVLGSATHAMFAPTPFVVHYKPRSTPFIIGVNKYLDGMRHGFQVGMRVRMIVEGEYPAVSGCTGSIVEVGDSSPQWPGSQWRSLRVEWDEPSGNERPPERVSPWEVEPCVGSPSQSARNKRTRSTDVADAGRDSGSSSGRTGQVQNESRNLGGSTGQPSNVPLQLFPASGRSSGQKDKGKLTENLRLFGFDLTGSNTDASQLQRPSTVDYFASCSTTQHQVKER